MEETRKDVMECLDRYADENDRLITELEAVIRKHGSKAYTVIFHILTNLDLDSDAGENCWRDIIEHYRTMEQIMGRKVNLLTSVCDYFCNINRNLKNPKVIEIHLFEKTAQSSRYDSLTGLLNRQTMEEILAREVSRGRRHQKELSVLFFDLDNFKQTNDTYGHLAGDAILKQVAGLIRDEKRAEDIASRYGGEELVVILPETGKNNALVVAERIRKRIEKTRFIYENIAIRTSLSGGLAAFPIDSQDAAELIKFADAAMYRAKNTGKNKTVLFSEEKRRFVRFDVAADIVVKQIGFGEAPDITARTKSISIDGILFESGQSFETGSKIQLRLTLRDMDPVEIIGTVSRVIPLSSGKYDVSVSFLEVDETARQEITRFLLPGPEEHLAQGIASAYQH